VLTLRPGEVVAAMNALPTAGRADGGCTLVGLPDNISLVVSYAGRAPVTVLLDRNCALAAAGGHTRLIRGTDVLHPALTDAFVARYREQLAASTSPAGVATAPCPAALAAKEVDRRTDASEPRDDIARNRGGADPFAPSALLEVRACRYRTGADGLRLSTQHARRTDLTALRDLLNSAGTVGTSTDANGSTSLTNGSGCPPGAPTTIDVLWLADATGAVAEARVPRAPCVEFDRRGLGGLAAPRPLLEQLDRWLA
jgi:hypothetical protein